MQNPSIDTTGFQAACAAKAREIRATPEHQAYQRELAEEFAATARQQAAQWQQESEDDDQSENTEYTLRDFLEKNPDQLINDGGTTWRTDNLLAELELEGDPLLDRAVHVDQSGIYFFDDRGYMISPAAYRFEQEQSQIEQQPDQQS